MAITSQHGSPQFPTIADRTTSHEAIDAAIELLQTRKDTWVALSVRERIGIVERLMKNFHAISQRWVDACNQAKGISNNPAFAGEEWSIGPWTLIKYLAQLRRVLTDIEVHGKPRIPGPVTTRTNGQVVAPVFPYTAYDRMIFCTVQNGLMQTGVTAEIWMEPGVQAETLPETQAVIYQDKQHSGKVALVLGAGNVSSIAPLDILYKLFVEDQVVVLKMNPVNAYLGPLIEESFQALIEPGYLQVIYGGATEGAYLCQHPGVEEIHITGSDKTFDAIVFGSGPEGAARKAAREPILTKPITGELGNVSPVIVIPGPWSADDIAYQAEHIATMLTTNAGFNCNATRVIIQHSDWNLREPLLQEIRNTLDQLPLRNAYYPGAQQRQKSFVAAHPEAEQFGNANDKQLSWTLIAGVDSQQEEDICFTTEAFCGLFAETTLKATSVSAYIEQAVTFANEQLWGSLSATILVHPASLKDPAVAAALEQALEDLRYGTVSINYWAGSSFTLGVSTWGAFPDHPIYDIQSGNGVVHNALMFSRPQKTVMRAPFRNTPVPPWFARRGKISGKVFPKLTDLEMAPSPLKLPAIFWSAFMG